MKIVPSLLLFLSIAFVGADQVEVPADPVDPPVEPADDGSGFNLFGLLTGIFQDLTARAPRASELLSNQECDETIRTQARCNSAPFDGVFMCRQYFSLFGLYESHHSVCVPNVAPGITLGLNNDECGCCVDDPCVADCPCACDGEKVDEDEDSGWRSVKPVLIPGVDGPVYGPTICVTQGYAVHMVNWGGRIVCDNSCNESSDDGDDEDDEEDVAAAAVPVP